MAANPNPEKDTATPKIDGTQTHVARTEDVPRTIPSPLQPSAVAPAAPETQPELKPRATLTPGDLVLAKPEVIPRHGDGDAPQPRPRTIEEARARLGDNRLTGKKMDQDGGVRRHLDIP